VKLWVIYHRAMNPTVYFVQAFVSDGQGGNLAGVVLDADALSDQQMQAIAAKVGASETAFALSSQNATHKVRFFTPTVEVDICGHATIATWSLLLAEGIHQPGSYSQETLAGTVQINIDDSGLVYMQQPEQTFGPVQDAEVLSKELGIDTLTVSP